MSRTIMITGASRGIGLEMTRQAAARGDKVIACCRDAMQATDLIAAAKQNDDITVLGLDVCAENDMNNIAAGMTRPIDILVCNAASNPYYGPMEGISDDQFEKILSNNVISNHWLVQQVAPGMRNRKDGAIIIVSSIGGMKGSTTIGAYNISKAADFQLARNLAAEFGADNVRINCIAPGLIKTDFARALWEDPQMLELVTATAPLKRIGLPEEVAGAAVFLAAPAGNFITGQSIVVDGGVTSV